jgi:two-component system alkaline phosphatase synthesis response regulator PhoP
MAENRKKIMIIDDNKDIVAMLKAMLSMKGYDVFIKQNVDDIEDSLIEIWPDLIIMDMLLSGVDGRKICKSLKNDSRFDPISVLMISAHPYAKEECLNAGADMFLGKPFDVQDFFNAVEKSLILRKK